MVQHIGIERIDENGKTLDFCDINFAEVMNLLSNEDNIIQISPLISYVDPYGDTYFNRLQIKDLVDELNMIGSKEQFKTLKTKIVTIVRFINLVDVHQYIKFIGD